MLVAAFCLAFAITPQGDEASLGNEWRVRRWSQNVGAASAEIRTALASEDWTERYHALDATHRAGAFVHLDRLLRDPHANVRAMALRVARRNSVEDLTYDVARRLTLDPFAEVREQLALTLGAPLEFDPKLDRGKLLLQLSLLDEDDAVQRTARRMLFSSFEFLGEQVSLLARVEPVERRHMLLDLLPYLMTARPRDVDFQRFEVVVAEDGPGALALVQIVKRRLQDWGDLQRLDVDKGALVRGWIDFDPALFEARDHSREAARKRLFATTTPQDSGLGRWLAYAALELELELSEQRLIGSSQYPGHRQHSQASYDDPQEAVWFLVESAAQALPAEEALDQFQSASPELAEIVWREVEDRIEDWSIDRMRLWTTHENDSVRFLAAQTISEALITGGKAEVGPLLVEMLGPDNAMRSSAFRWLCDARVERERWMAALHAAWLEYPESEQLERLRAVPRDIAPTAFRAELLAFLSNEETRQPSVIELLTTFVGDEAVELALAEALEAELAHLETGPPLADFRAHEWHAKGLLRALHTMRGAEFASAVENALERMLAAAPTLADGERHDPELPKTCAWSLGRTAAGRELLSTWLERHVPRRVRVEVAMALVGDASAVGALEQDYLGCDTELRLRILRAFAKGTDAASLAFLARVGMAESSAQSERIAALESLRKRDALDELGLAVESVTSIDVLRAAIQYVAEIGGDRARDLLMGHRSRQPYPQEDALVPNLEIMENLRLLRGDFLVAIARTGPLEEELLEECFRWPLRSAESDLRQRFRGERGPSPSFVWRAEFELAALLAEHEQLGAALQAAGEWTRLDGRFLYGMAEAVRESGHVAGELAPLYRAALVAFEGEGEVQAGTRLSIGATLRLAELAEREERWLDFRYWCDRLLAAEHSGPGSQTAFAHYMGTYDRRAGVDPHARLYAARVQAEAWEALARGGPARQLAAEARKFIGVSRLAHKAQTRLEEQL